MDVRIDITAEIEKLKASLFCKCNTPKTQRFNCGHSFCPSCEENVKNSTSCGVCKETQIVEDDEALIESKNFALETFRKITIALNQLVVESRPLNTNLEGFANKIYEYEVLLSAPFKCNRKGESPLHLACKSKNLSELERCISDGHSLNCKDYAGWTPLHEAVESNFHEGVQMLLEASALCDVPGDLYVTPLHKAIVKSNSKRNYDIIRLLKKYGADVNARDYNGETPLTLSNDVVKEILLGDIDEIVVVKKVFVDRLVVCYKNVKAKQKKELLKAVDVTSTITDQTTHLIMEDENDHMETLKGVLHGIFVTDTKWLNDCVATDGKIVVANSGYFITNENNRRSVLNRLLGRPRLFDGINFYVMGHNKEVVIDGKKFLKGDLITLIKAGGGRMLSRCPTPTTASQLCVPYHAANKLKMKKVCYNYVIYDEGDPPELQYNMQEIKHKSSKWLIDCVINYRIG